jgi:hypothetical protein
MLPADGTWRNGLMLPADGTWRGESVPVGVAHRLRPVAGADLGQHVVDVALHRGLADEQLGRDLGIRQARPDQPQDFGFPGSKPVRKL